ncbi:MAG TPA: hypothetical protein VLH77_01260, partial [Gammaproteobacteria bacterium]|nr:hypothetical protein [Gammaproteobacteria bacterium]
MLHDAKNKHFAQRLNKCLDELDQRADVRKRSAMLSKMLNIPRQLAWMLLEGHHIPDETLLNEIAREFEVETSW